MSYIPEELTPFQDGFKLTIRVRNERFIQICQTMRSLGYNYTGYGMFRRNV